MPHKYIEDRIEWQRKYNAEHKKERNASQHKMKNIFKIEVLTHYGGRKLACVQCGEDRLACLSIDHINGNGGKHRKQMKMNGGMPFYKWLKKNNYPKEYQTLCMNCQFAKIEIDREVARGM